MNDQYDGTSIEVLRDADHIRRRPAMYIGDTGKTGLHQLVYILIDYSLGEVAIGVCKNISVKINMDGSISVGDDGPGIPVDLNHRQLSTLEILMTMMMVGGMHGYCRLVVAALAEWTEAEVRRDGKVYVQEYERGKAVTAVSEVGMTPGNRTGTRITFKPDREIFINVLFDFVILENRLRELAFLNKGLAIKLIDKRSGKEEVFKYDRGLSEFVEYLNRFDIPLHKPIYAENTIDNVRVEAAIQFTTSEEERRHCYANNEPNSTGTHLAGLLTGVTQALRAYGTEQNLFGEIAPIGEDLRCGMTGVVSVRLPQPQFESSTRLRLHNPEVEGIVASVVGQAFAKFLEENLEDGSKIVTKAVLAAKSRLALEAMDQGRRPS